jgi:SET domain-containing protein
MSQSAATSDVEVRPSEVEGLGVFAARDFALGERIRVVNIAREITEDAPLRPEDGERFEHQARPNGKTVLYGYPDRHYNHSCDPNAWDRFVEGPDGELITEIVARRPIATGDEIRLDYLINNSGGDSWPCNCGVPRCRGETSVSFFTLPIDQQREYLPLLADWFIARHPDEIAALRRDAPEDAAPSDGGR